jgi:NUMOD3 motif
MYLQNKYTNWYFSIISNSKNRLHVDGYTENHHIVPKSLGGSNDPHNLVKLTAREHFVCHMLLPKMLEGDNRQKMIYACWAMANQKRSDQDRYKINSRLYSMVKSQASINHKSFKHTEEHKKRVSQRHKGKVITEETRKRMSDSAKKRKMSPEGFERFREAHKTKQFKHTEEHKKKVSERHKGKTLSIESRKKISESQKARHHKKFLIK